IKHFGCLLSKTHVWLPLQDQPHFYSTLRCIDQLTQQTIAGKEIRIGNEDICARCTNCYAIRIFDGCRVGIVIPDDQAPAGISGWRSQTGRPAPSAAPDPCRLQHAACKVGDVRSQRSTHLDGVILLGHRTKFSKMVDGKVDAADKGDLAVYGDDLAMHASEQVGPYAQQARPGIENMQPYPGVCKAFYELFG